MIIAFWLLILHNYKGNDLRLNGSVLLPIEEKSHQMFGATVVSSKNADSVLVKISAQPIRSNFINEFS